ncbi:hypothetical protein P7K49_018130 [Saguinus oedipus]|uniref:G-protein coupled receptors family 1 profile domain-containing protein n=1 Tax=Saguinus oedipus TaxID=9490 RepID=A0ABQ9V5L8_SAGOE|nr:hypothetical protein P7K49_018130 [Saguinus oedipus]
MSRSAAATTTGPSTSEHSLTGQPAPRHPLSGRLAWRDFLRGGGGRLALLRGGRGGRGAGEPEGRERGRHRCRSRWRRSRRVRCGVGGWGGGLEAAPLLSHGAAVAAQALVLLLIFLLSSLGNCAVMSVIVKHRQLRTVTNAFILSLSLSDLLTALLCLPAAFLDLFTPPGGSAPAATTGPWHGFCAASRFFSSCFGILSTFSVALISLDCYCAIVRPPREKIGRRRALQLLAGAWLAALGFSLPWELLGAPRELAAAQSFHGCLYRTSPDPAQLGAAYSVGLVVACYLLPFLLMCFCHYHICKTVHLSDVRVRPVTTYARVLRFFSEVRTATTVLIMIIFVICCWGPYCVLVLLAAAQQAQAAQVPSLLNVVSVWLTWANGAINPVIYAIRNPNISMLLGRTGRRATGLGMWTLSCLARVRVCKPEASIAFETAMPTGWGPAAGCPLPPRPAG